MESIGEKLSAARDTKGVSVEQAARDTHIAKRFIAAMEAEDFDQFPGEAYLLGFLRNYAGYLGLDGENLISLYHNIRIQEQPAPIDELLDRNPGPRVSPRLLLVLGLGLVLGVAGALVVFGVVDMPETPERDSTEPASDTEAEGPLVLDDQFVERRFAEGSRVAVPVDGRRALLEFVSIEERVSIGSDAGIVQVGENEERVLDLTGEGSGDIRLAVRRIYRDADPPSVVARVDRVLDGPAARSPERAGTMTQADLSELGIGMTADPARERSAVVVAEFAALEEYFVEADFRGLTMFRWQVDDEPREERYLSNGDRVRTSVNDLIRIWSSNAGNVRLRVAGNPVDLGAQGEVAAAVIRWRQVPDGTWVLELLPMY